MKHNLHSWAFLIIFLLVTSSHSSARLLAAQKGAEKVKIKDFDKGVVSFEDSFSNLMGLEICENGDEECLKRRVIAEAHLDYIYTQHHKP